MPVRNPFPVKGAGGNEAAHGGPGPARRPVRGPPFPLTSERLRRAVGGRRPL